MKKKVFGILGVAAFAALVAINVSINSRGEDLSDLTLANVEALARGEDGEKTMYRIKSYCSCYIGNRYVSQSITECEAYTCSGPCNTSCTKTSCPYGSSC